MRRAEIGSARAHKERARVVRFLAAGPAILRAAAKEGTVLLDGGERGMVSAASTTLAALVRDGVMRREGTGLSLSPEGRALAKRTDAGDAPFRAQHMDLGTRTLQTEAGERKVEVDFSESPLAQLTRRRTKNGTPFLADNEFRAGERLRSDYTRGRIMPRLGANWSAAVADGRRGGDNGIADLTDAALAARQRVDQALIAVGPELSGVLVDVCCFLKGLERVEAERGWPVRSAKVVLKTALAALSRHYEPQSRPRTRSVLHWGAEDYRPRIRR